jgi:hypothetical protein
MQAARNEQIDPPDEASDLAVYLAHLAGLQSRVDELTHERQAMQAENWRLLCKISAPDAPVWMTLKRAADKAGCTYELARAFAARAVASGRLNEATKDGGRVSVNVTALIAYLAR